MRSFKLTSLIGLSAVFAVLPLSALPAAAQTTTMDVVGPHSAYCGSWMNGTFMPNGRCTDDTTTTVTTTTGGMTAMNPGHAPGRVAGTITNISGHLVTLQQSAQTIVINDQPALDSRKTGRIANGRSVLAHGYWSNGTFFATRVDQQ